MWRLLYLCVFVGFGMVALYDLAIGDEHNPIYNGIAIVVAIVGAAVVIWQMATPPTSNFCAESGDEKFTSQQSSGSQSRQTVDADQ